MHMLRGSASNRFFGYQVASSGAMIPSMSTCILSTTGNSLVIYSLSVSGSTRCNHDFLMGDFSSYMRPLPLLAETLILGFLSLLKSPSVLTRSLCKFHTTDKVCVQYQDNIS